MELAATAPEQSELHLPGRYERRHLMPGVTSGQIRVTIGDEYRFPLGSQFVLDGAGTQETLELEQHYDPETGIYEFDLGPFQPAALYAGRILHGGAITEMFANEPLYAYASRPAAGPPIGARVDGFEPEGPPQTSSVAAALTGWDGRPDDEAFAQFEPRHGEDMADYVLAVLEGAGGAGAV